MGSTSPLVALLSIKPTYAEAIFSGRKKVEFRKTKFRRAVSHIVVYATAPVQRVIGWFVTGETHQSSPRQLWRRFATVGGILREDFLSYYSKHEQGVAIEVRATRRLKKPILLHRVTSSPPPQSYIYLPASALLSLASNSMPSKTPKRLVRKRAKIKKISAKSSKVTKKRSIANSR
jgi:predicted transcriptional regulator